MMEALATLPKSLLHAARHWKWETFTLPGVSSATVNGVNLEIGSLSPKMKKTILLGGYEQPEISMCEKLVTDGDSIIELGSALGFVSLYCLKFRSARNVYCIEANPTTIELLKKNYRANGYEPLVLHGALAASDGEVSLQTDDDFWGHSVASETSSQAPNKSVQVPAFTFESLLSRAPFRPNVLIIDVEGAETLIPWHKLPPDITKVIIELHPHLVGNKRSFNILNDLARNGFEPIFGAGSVFGFKREVA